MHATHSSLDTHSSNIDKVLERWSPKLASHSMEQSDTSAFVTSLLMRMQLCRWQPLVIISNTPYTKCVIGPDDIDRLHNNKCWSRMISRFDILGFSEWHLTWHHEIYRSRRVFCNSNMVSGNQKEKSPVFKPTIAGY